MVKFYQKRNVLFSHLEFSATNYKTMNESSPQPATVSLKHLPAGGDCPKLPSTYLAVPVLLLGSSAFKVITEVFLSVN